MRSRSRSTSSPESRRRMIAAALEVEAEQYVAPFVEDGKRLVVRNWPRPESATVSSGTMRLRAPRVNDERVDEQTGAR